jgi:hypothetical protein
MLIAVINFTRIVKMQVVWYEFGCKGRYKALSLYSNGLTFGAYDLQSLISPPD